MTTFHLDKFLSGHVFAFLMIFSRIGSAMILFPGIGEPYVSARIRLLLAFSLSFLLMEPLLGRIPMPPEAIPDLFKMLGYEILIGLFFGTMLRMLLSALESAGAVIALQTGLSNAQVLNPSLAIQSTLASAFLSITGVTLIFVTGLDQVMFRSLIAIYDVFPPGGTPMPGDMAQTVIQMTNRSFVLGIELAMPFLIMGLLMFMALGIMQKLMPQVQLFLVALPVQIWGGLGLFGITLAGIMTIWLQYFGSFFNSFFEK
jgi:flagellar biosynthetic protein FliR